MKFFIIGLIITSNAALFAQITPNLGANNDDKLTPILDSDPQYLWSNEPFGTYPQSAEVVEKRSANTKHFRNEYGTYTAHISSGDIHYVENGQWKTIFHTIVPSSTGFENTTNKHKTYYPATSTGSIKTILPGGAFFKDMIGMQLYYEVNGQAVQAQNIQNRQGMVNYNELTYSNVYGAGIDLRLTQNTTQRKMDYIIQSNTALNNIPSGAQFLVFEEKAELPNGWTAELIDNEIVLKDAAGYVKAKYEKPVFTDTPEHHHHHEGEEHIHVHNQDNPRTESEIIGTYEILKNGNILTIKTKVPLSWLTDTQRNFPVVIDPTVNVTMPNTANWTGSFQTYSGFTGNTIDNTNNDVIRLGSESSWGDVYHSWVKFDITSLPDNHCINSAALWYNIYSHATTDAVCVTQVNIRHMANDPVAVGNAARLADIYDGDIYASTDFAIKAAGGNDVWRTRSLTNNLHHLQGSLPVNWFAIGLQTTAVHHSSSDWIFIRGRSHANRPYLRVDYSTPSTAPTSVSGGGTYCWGNNITLNSVGGTNAAGIAHVWYKGGCNNAFTQTWAGMPYGTSATTVNSTTGGILNVTSTSNDPMINMFGLGSFNPSTYRYVNIRYRVVSGTAGNVELFFLNGHHAAPHGEHHVSAPLISDNQWHIVAVDMHQNSHYVGDGSNITGWRYDWATANGVTMELDFIQLSQYPMIDENNATTVLEWTPSHPDYPTAGTTTYAAAKIDYCAATSCASTTVTLPNRTTLLALNGESATCTVNPSETVHFYNTSSGRYIATVTANATGLGSVTSTTYVDVPSPVSGTPINTQACGDPGFVTAVLGRHWTINPTTNASATVRLPYYDQELTWLYPASTASSSPYDDLSSQAQLGLSKYSGPANVNNLWNDNCPPGGSGGTTWQGPNAFGNLSGYAPGWPANTDRYSMFNITGFSEFWLHASNTIITPLAVVLSDFSASCDNRNITWTTASEQNSSHFTLERSRDGYNWEPIKTVAGAGTTNATNFYEVNDNVSAEMYYRLKQTDFDGKSEYFGPIHVNCTGAANELIVYPNPNNGTFTVAVNTSEEMGEATIYVHDVHGKIVASREINVLTGTNTIHFEGDNLMRGTYFVSIQEKNKKTFIPVKLIIQ